MRVLTIPHFATRYEDLDLRAFYLIGGSFADQFLPDQARRTSPNERANRIMLHVEKAEYMSLCFVLSAQARRREHWEAHSHVR